MTTERIAEIENMLAGYEAWRERWHGVSGIRSKPRPGEVALRELLEEVKSGGGLPTIEKEAAG